MSHKKFHRSTIIPEIINISRIRSVFALCIYLLGFSVYAQDSILFSTPPKVTALVHFTLSDGLAANCVDQGFIDKKGRLWFNPCRDAAREFRLSFFQFDGSQSFFYELRPDWLPVESMAPVLYILGETTDGFLYGADRENKILFYWHPDTREQNFFRLKPGEVLLNMDADANGKILALTMEQANETYRITILFDEQRVEASIQLDFTDDSLPNTPNQFAYPFEVTNEAAFFFHQRKGLVRFDRSQGKIDFTPWSDFSDILPVLTNYLDIPAPRESASQIPKTSMEWKIIDVNKEELLLFLGMQNGFFTLDINTNKLTPHDIINNRLILSGKGGEGEMIDRVVQGEPGGGIMLRVYFTKDQADNLLITSGYFDPWTATKEIEYFKAILRDEKGEWYDYSEPIQVLNNTNETSFHVPGGYFSGDFRYVLGSTTIQEGLAILGLQADLGITTIKMFPTYSASAIKNLDGKTLMVNSDLQIQRFDQQNGKWSTDLTQTTSEMRLQNNRLIPGGYHIQTRAFSPLIIKDEKVWMSAAWYHPKERTGLQWYDPKTNESDHIPTEVKFQKFIFINDEEVALFTDDGTFENLGDMYLFNIQSKELRPFLHNNIPLSLGAMVNDLIYDGDSLLWVGAQNGLWQIDISAEKVVHFSESEYLQHQNVLCINEGENGNLWLGTNKSGVLIFNPDTGAIKQVSEAEGLSNNTVVGILADDDLNRWVSTFDGLTILDAKGRVLYVLNEHDGLASNSFNHSSFAKLLDGKLAFGSASSVSILDPKYVLSTLSKKKPIKIYFTGLSYYDKEKKRYLAYQGSLGLTKMIQIPASQRYLNLDFALSDYVNIQQQTYRYRILPSGYSNEEASVIPWINIGAESRVTINNLPAGEHIVQVGGSDMHANQVVAPLELSIHVGEIFYRQWWFYLLVAMPFVLGAWVWIRQINSERGRLEVEVGRRTAQIRKDKTTIETQATQLQELDLAKSRFFTNISHEFRTPLTVILGMVEQIKDQEKVSKLIRRNANQLLDLINQILDLRKLESSNLQAKFIQGDMVAYLHYLTESFHSLAEAKKVQLKFESSAQHLVLDYDPERMLHIISNLLGNAVKFTPAGGEVKIELESQQNIDVPTYQIAVSDTGVGISDEKLAHIFDRFYQVDDEGSRTGTGTGIGLSLVKELVGLLKGQINVESKPGVGTSFNIILPLTNKAELKDDIPKTVTSTALLPLTLSAVQLDTNGTENTALPRLLIVEDNADVMEYLITCLKEDYQLLFAANGQEGIEVAQEEVPDIIISDVMMPKADGFELCHTLKTDLRTSHIPIILLTAKADLDSRITGLQRGADAYLAKPFNQRELNMQLQNLLALRQQLRDRYSNTEYLEPTEDIAVQQEDQFIMLLRETILENMTEEHFGVPELCKKVGMSRTQLHNKIKTLTDRSASHFIRLVRVERACELFRDPELNVSQVSFEVGIDSLQYFSELFRQEKGLSPNKYREKLHLEQ